ncbi:carboxymuconolactone decarboxylase family protein [Paenibacillus sp. FSL R5-0527]|uniref:carboxymuconolactone decarboxylase family protein n=1 Tax=Paenibacillus TaxID=44249 RepID=UPI00097A1362|nr:carboxymuconolactone decarboxylase family protein [Paenibacillus macerans]MED4957670.1 carboxymuconolactone decarboxylase family protein [Paenibacillus macerans]OMG50706.1 gamma-carboxymuconolactone decarboxylase [Paenibacillus macerans]
MSLVSEKIKAYKDEIGRYGDSLPGITEAYHAFTGASLGDGELDAKTKQLIALGIALSTNNEICTFYHAEEAKSKGATDAEILETVAVASAALAGNALSQGVTRVQQALSSPPVQ